YHFFPITSFSALLSSVRSATSSLSFLFSSSSARRRLASLTSRPPYLAFQRWYVGPLIPCLRHTSASFAPASTSFSTPMICSSVNRLFRILSSGPLEDSRFAWSSFRGAGQHQNVACLDGRVDLRRMRDWQGRHE